MISATDGGIFRSENCFQDTVEWNTLNNGYYTTQLYTATTSKNANSDVLHGGFQDNGNFVTFSENITDPWSMPFNGDGAYSGIADNEEDFYLTIQRGVAYKMKLDNQANRLAFNRLDPLSADSTTYQFINPFTMDENNDNLCYLAAGSKLWRNNDLSSVPYNDDHTRNDIGWSTYTDGAFNSSMDITCIRTSVTPSNILYYGTDSKYIHRVDGANVGDPAHVAITNIPTGSGVHCADIAIHPEDPDKIMVVFSNYNTYSLFYSDDAGGSWSKVAGNLEQNTSGSGNGPSCRTAQIIPLGNSTLYVVGTSIGLFATSNLDGPNTVWEMIAKDDIGNVIIEQIDYRHSDGRFTVATYGSGIFQTTLTEIGDVLTVNDIDVNELTIYPNPTSDIINIEFDVKKEDKVSWTLYNEVGKIISTASEKVITGENNLTINCSSLKSGIYFVSLNINKNIITKQFIKK